MSARPVVKTSHMSPSMQEFAIMAAQDAIANFTTEQEIATSIKAKFEQHFPSTWHCFVGRNFGQMGICIFATA